MSILVIGGDKIDSIKSTLLDLGASDITHWKSRKVHTTSKVIPNKTEYIVMLTTFLKHNTMFHFKTEAKKKNIPIIFSKRSSIDLKESFKEKVGV
jgi:hypothetical protein